MPIKMHIGSEQVRQYIQKVFSNAKIEERIDGGASEPLTPVEDRVLLDLQEP
jgi:hypothetical protein